MSGSKSSSDHENARALLERFLRIRQAETGSGGTLKRRPSLTLSRQAGIGGRDLASRLADYLNRLDDEGAIPGWVKVDSDLLDTLIKRLGGPRETPSTNRPDSGTIVSMFGNQSPTPAAAGADAEAAAGSLTHPASAAIRRLCEMGNAIVLGRGGHRASAGLDNVFRVRLIADRAFRVKTYAEHYGVHDLTEADRMVERTDAARSRYLERHFDSDIDDPSHYHLTLNLTDIPRTVAIQLIGDSLLEWSASRDRDDDGEKPIEPGTSGAANTIAANAPS